MTNWPPLALTAIGMWGLPSGRLAYLFVCLFVRRIFCKGYLRRGLIQGDEIWHDGRPRWVAGHLPFGELWPRGYPQGQKVKNFDNTHLVGCLCNLAEV